MPAIQFTPLEVEALRHRLDIGEVIAQVFADTDGLDHHNPAEVERCAAQLSAYVDSRWPFLLDGLDSLYRDVMVEAVEGSTWNAVHDSADVSPQRRTAAARALRSAAEKIAAAYGLDPLTIPEA